MDEIAGEIIDRETALADFDHARDDFETAFGLVPDEALGFTAADEDFSIGAIVPHLRLTIEGYFDLLNMLRDAEYRQIELVVGATPVSGGPSAVLHPLPASEESPPPEGDRQAALDRMESTYDLLAARLRELAYDEYSRQTPVVFPDSDVPSPVRASGILRDLTEHYREHAEQALKMLHEWKGEA